MSEVTKRLDIDKFDCPMCGYGSAVGDRAHYIAYNACSDPPCTTSGVIRLAVGFTITCFRCAYSWKAMCEQFAENKHEEVQ